MLKFERPADQSQKARDKRAGYGKTYFEKYAGGAENAPFFDAKTPDSAPFINKLISGYNHNKGRGGKKVEYIVIHYTGALGDARNNCQYFVGGNRNASAHFFVGYDGAIWQSVEEENAAWHCGGGMQGSSGGSFHGKCKSQNSIGIEMCVRKKSTATMSAADKDWYFEDATVQSTAALVKYLMKKYGVPADRVIRHYDVTGKTCPNPYVYNTGKHTWDGFKCLIGGSAPAITNTQAKPETMLFGKGTYIVTASSIRVRTGPGTDYPQKKFSEMSANAQAVNALKKSTGLAFYVNGIAFDALEVVKKSDGEYWAKTPSGYVAMMYDGNKYVVKK